jgi:hypothetical protein
MAVNPASTIVDGPGYYSDNNIIGIQWRTGRITFKFPKGDEKRAEQLLELLKGSKIKVKTWI